MKILYISNYPLSGNLSPSCNEMGFVEELLITFQQDIYLFIENNADEINISRNQVSYFNNVPITRPIQFIFHAFKWALKAKKMASMHNSDVIIIRTNRAPLKEILLILFTKTKVILKSSDKYWIYGKSKGYIDNILSKLDLLLFYILHRIAAGIECVTPEFREMFINSGIDANKLCVVTNGISTLNFNIQNHKKEMTRFPVLGYCGAKPSERGAEEIFFLVTALKDLYPKILGVVIGNDQNIIKLQKKIQEQKLEYYFNFLGEVPFRDIPQYLQQFDIGYSFVSALDQIGGNASMKIRQYLACGACVITFPLGSQFVEENQLGYLVDPNNKKELLDNTINCIDKIQKNQDLIRSVNSDYAHKHFSHKILLEQRIEFWKFIVSGINDTKNFRKKRN
jgi:hypothetical protein